MNLTSSSATGTITVSRDGDGAITANSSATGVATTSVSGTTVTVTAIADGSATITVKMNQGTNYTAYTASDKTVSVSASGFDSQVCALSAATTSNTSVGNIICSNGHVHTSANPNCGGTAVGIVAYVGNGEANNSYNRGLALSMSDLTSAADTKWRSSGSGTDLTNQYSSLTSECLADLNGLSYTDVLIGKGASYPAAQKIAAYRTSCSVPSGCSSWFLPTIGQWSLILQGLTGKNTALSTGTNNDYKGGAINTILEGFAGTSARMKSDSGGFWSSTEGSAGLAWGMDFSDGDADNNGETNNLRVRAVLAF